MKLDQYLQSRDEAPKVFAARIGRSREAVRRYLCGERIPDHETMAKIALATGGQVTANDFHGIAAPVAAKAA